MKVNRFHGKVHEDGVCAGCSWELLLSLTNQNCILDDLVMMIMMMIMMMMMTTTTMMIMTMTKMFSNQLFAADRHLETAVDDLTSRPDQHVMIICTHNDN